MITYIESTIKKCLKPKIIFKRTAIESDMHYYRLDYFSMDEKYCILELFFNEDDIIALTPPPLLGTGEFTLEDKICHSVIRFDKKINYTKRASKVFTKKDLDKYFKDMKDSYTDRLLGLYVFGFVVNKVTISLYPCRIVLVRYSYNGLDMPLIKVLMNEGVVGRYPSMSEPLVEELNKIFVRR